MSRPEHLAPAEVYYGDSEAGKYTSNTRIQAIQLDMARRCIEMLLLPGGAPGLVLDIGCGSGLSGDALAAAGHAWVGLDVSPDMLAIAHARGCGAGGGEEGGVGELLLGDMGHGFGFRAGMFDGAISVSALQWLCYSDRKGHRSGTRLEAFFSALYRALRRGARAALQFYPEPGAPGEAQLELITQSAKRAGFTGGLVVDFPHSKRLKKYYLCLITGGDAGRGGAEGAAGSGSSSSSSAGRLPAAMGGGGGGGGSGGGMDGGEGEEEGEEEDEEEDEEEGEGEGEEEGEEGEGEDGLLPSAAAAGGGGSRGGAAARAAARAAGVVPYEGRRGAAGASAALAAKARRKKRVVQPKVKSRSWVVAKKEAQRRRGVETRPDSKYTARKRKPKF